MAMKRLQDKIAIITGGSGGIGKCASILHATPRDDLPLLVAQLPDVRAIPLCIEWLLVHAAAPPVCRRDDTDVTIGMGGDVRRLPLIDPNVIEQIVLPPLTGLLRIIRLSRGRPDACRDGKTGRST